LTSAARAFCRADRSSSTCDTQNNVTVTTTETRATVVVFTGVLACSSPKHDWHVRGLTTPNMGLARYLSHQSRLPSKLPRELLRLVRRREAVGTLDEWVTYSDAEEDEERCDQPRVVLLPSLSCEAVALQGSPFLRFAPAVLGALDIMSQLR
jgi:hypothetical protein